jgi:hypothetical protein
MSEVNIDVDLVQKSGSNLIKKLYLKSFVCLHLGLILLVKFHKLELL